MYYPKVLERVDSPEQIFHRSFSLGAPDNIPFNFNHDNLNDTKILYFVDHMQKKYITHWKHSLCNSQKLEIYNVFKDSYTPSIYLDVTRKIQIEKHLWNLE